MEISIQSIHFTADQKLLEFINKKVSKLDSINNRILNCDVYLKLENINNPENKITEIKVSVPGATFFAKEQCKTFEEAADQSIESLRKQMTKAKTKMTDH